MIEELKVIIKAEVDKFKQGIDEAEKQTKSFKEQVAEAGKSVEDNLSQAGDKISSGLKTASTAMAAAGAALLALGASTVEYRQNQAQLNAAFEQAKLSTESATGVYRELYKVIGDDGQTVESAANIAMLANSEEQAAKWAGLASGVLGTFHDTLQPEAFYEAANETLKLGEATGAFAQMLEQTGVMSVDEFNKKLALCANETEKQTFMLNVSEQAMGKAGEAYNEATKDIQAQREAQTKLNESMAKLGTAITPVLTMLTTLAGEVLSSLAPMIENFVTNYLPTIQSLLSGLVGTIGSILGFMREHPVLMASIATAIGVIITAIIAYNAVQAIKTAMAAAEVTSVWGLVAAYAAQAVAMAAALAPYIAIVAAIAAVIAIIVLLVKHWDDVTAAFTKAGKVIKEKTEEMGKAVKEKFTQMKDDVTKKASEIKKSVTDYFGQAKQEAVNKFNDMKSSISNSANNIKQSVSNAFSNMRSSISSALSSAWSNVTNIFSNIYSKISSVMSNCSNAVKTAIDKIKSFFKFEWSLPKIKLPHFSISGEFSLSPPSIPKINVDWYAMGGVFDKPTLFSYGGGIGGLAEAGTEAIVPLENNLGWLDKLATMLSNRMGGNTPIVLQVDGKTFAQTSVNCINQLTKQRGSLPLIIT